MTPALTFHTVPLHHFTSLQPICLPSPTTLLYRLLGFFQEKINLVSLLDT